MNYLRERTGEILSGMGVETETAVYSCGEELMAELRGAQDGGGADVVFLDIDMPGMSGFEAAEMLRDLPAKPLLLFVTGMDDLVYDAFSLSAFLVSEKDGSRTSAGSGGEDSPAF